MPNLSTITPKGEQRIAQVLAVDDPMPGFDATSPHARRIRELERENAELRTELNRLRAQNQQDREER